jgi:hypothetical protein
MPFYINQCGFSVDRNRIVLIHNIISGSKRIYVNNVLEKTTPVRLFECNSKHSINVDGGAYELIITAKWFGGFKYNFIPRECGYGLLDEALL